MVSLNVASMFSGIGSMRLAFENDCLGFDADAGWLWEPRVSPWSFCWSNQWEPPVREDRNVQHAYDIYTRRFGLAGAVNADIVQYLDYPDFYDVSFPDSIDLLVAGFPCQDYSIVNVGRGGIEGKKGVLWWQIYRVLSERSPRMFLFENVDNLIFSPNASHRGRDFAIMLSSLRSLGYSLEWRVVNSADCGVPQARNRIFIFGSLDDLWSGDRKFVLDSAFPGINIFDGFLDLPEDLVEITESFKHRFSRMGRLVDGRVELWRFEPEQVDHMPLSDVLQGLSVVASRFPHCVVKPEKIDFDSPVKGTWNYAKSVSSLDGSGPMAFPDPVDRPSRTLTTKCGEVSPMRETMLIFQPLDGLDESLFSRGKYQPLDVDGVPMLFRTLSPVELERVMTFPDDWTLNGRLSEIPRSYRAFVLGNSCPPLEIVRIRDAIESVVCC